MAEMPVAEITLSVTKIDGVAPITRESFIAAYVDNNPRNQCRDASALWTRLHDRTTHGEEIDEDPPGTQRGYARPACEDCHPDHECPGPR